VLAIAQQAYRLSPTDAEDVFQDVFTRTYERLGDLRNDDALRPWLAQLTRRLCIDRIRAGAREMADADAIELEGSDDTIERLDEALAVHEALEAMPVACREILDRFFRRDESYAVIGAALGLPSGTIASRISRCLGKLRAQLEGREPASGTS
jgi:RNA polymerase sigma-70 factor (ECF subfamily)